MCNVDGHAPSVLLVDDDPVFLRQTSRYLERMASVRIVGTACNAAEALTQFEQFGPDVVLLDWRLAGGLGIDIIPAFRHGIPSVRIIMLTTMEPAYRDLALASGANGFVQKFDLAADLIPEIDRVMQLAES